MFVISFQVSSERASKSIDSSCNDFDFLVMNVTVIEEHEWSFAVFLCII